MKKGLLSLNNERGIALLTTLMLMVLGLGIVTILLYTTTHSTRIAALEQDYTKALDAAKGGADLLITLIRYPLLQPPFGAVKPNPACWTNKINYITYDDDVLSNWPSCTSAADAVNPDPTVEPDLTVTLADYQVYAKIIYTREVLDSSCTPSGEDDCADYLYVVKVRGQAPNSTTVAEISFLYQIDKP